jgi:hypothetical protein
MCLLTGSLWGRPMWGTYWVWDARLTSVLVLFLMYLGVIALWRATAAEPARACRGVTYNSFRVDFRMTEGIRATRLGETSRHGDLYDAGFSPI